MESSDGSKGMWVLGFYLSQLSGDSMHHHDEELLLPSFSPI
jgi:hypothetical protein